MEFKTVLLDPPWPEKGGGVSKRGADRHYITLSHKDIYRVTVTSEVWPKIDDNAHMYLWVTDNYLLQGIILMGQLNFRYICTLPWIKLKDAAFEKLTGKELSLLEGQSLAEIFVSLLKMGLGQYFRGESELCLFGVRGNGFNVKTERKDLGDVIIGPRGQHSRKPESSYEKIEARSKGPYLELYARPPCREGWTVWGNEIVSY